MHRRDFLWLSSLVAAGLPFGLHADDARPAQFIEWWRFRMLPGRSRSRLTRFVADALVPALNRQGIQPVGVFRARYGEDSLTLRLLLPHPNLASVATVTDRLVEDAEFRDAGKDVLAAPMSQLAYVRLERELMVAFRDFPQVVVPKKRGVFELRKYESHSLVAGKKKIEMFNEGKEIPIFLKTGFEPVFFAETVVGPQLPNLQYMVAFEDLAARDAAWQRFIRHPDWIKLSADPQYKDTVSNIHDTILLPLPCSQI